MELLMASLAEDPHFWALIGPNYSGMGAVARRLMTADSPWHMCDGVPDPLQQSCVLFPQTHSS